MVAKVKKAKPSPFANCTVERKSSSTLNELPVFVKDGKSLVVPSGASCHLYNASTGDHIKELFTCSANIISCQLHPFENNLLIATTEEGEVKTFNLKTDVVQCTTQLKLSGKVLFAQKIPKFNVDKKFVSWGDYDENFNWQKADLSLGNTRFVSCRVDSCEKPPHGVLIWASWCLSDEHQAHISLFSLKTGEQVKQVIFRNIALKKCKMNFVLGMGFFVGMSGDFVYAAQFSNSSELHYRGLRFMIGFDIELTCLALHPIERVFATGDSLGRVIVWRNVGHERPLKDVRHWHTLPVEAVVFSDHGSLLYSGGGEGVLVVWSLESQHRNFLPRLSASITNLALGPDSRSLAVSTLDSKILVVDANLHPISTIQHFSRWSAGHASTSSVFAFDSRSNAFVLNARTGHLQFLSVRDNGRFLYTLDVTNANVHSAERGMAISNAEVTHAVLSRSGKWMATAEARRDELSAESRLKFWWFDEARQSFSLNTNVELPHGELGLHAVEMSCEEVLATTGPDGHLKLWSPVETHFGDKVSVHWSLQSSGTLGAVAPRPAAFSQDGSLVAVGFGPALALWDVDTCRLTCSLTPPFQRDNLTAVKFGSKDFVHVAIAGTALTISSWNLVTLTMLWTVRLNLSLLISDPDSIFMCAVTPSSVFIFTPGSEQPEATLPHKSGSPFVSGRFVSFEDKPKILLLSAEQEVYLVHDPRDAEPGSAVSGGGDALNLTPFSWQVAEASTDDVMRDKGLTAIKSQLGSEFAATIRDAPAHTLPNPSFLCSDLLRSLLIVTRSTTGAVGDKKIPADPDDEVVVVEGQETRQSELTTDEQLTRTLNKLFL